MFLSDNFDAYKQAIIANFALSLGRFITNSGKYIYKEYKLPSNLNYALVEKERNIVGKIISTKPKIIFGSKKNIHNILEGFFKDQKVNVSFIERLNLTKRQHNARLARKSISYSKEINALKYQETISRTYYNFCLEHSTLKVPLRKNEQGKYRWLKRTPAMAENITDHIWSFQELLFFV